MMDTNQWDAKKYNLGNYVQRRYAEKILKDYNVSESSDVLDIGCGDGGITKWLSIRAKKGNTLGADRSEAMIQHATEQYADINNVSFKVCDAMNIDVLGKFDLITSFSCFHWVKDKAQLFVKLYEALNSGGKFLVTFPVGDNVTDRSIETVLNRQKWLEKYGKYHIPVYWATQQQLELWLSELGFVIDQLKVKHDSILLSDIGAYHDFVSALPLFTHVHDAKDKAMMVDEITEFFDTHCQNEHAGKIVFPIKCHLIQAHKK